MGFYFHYLQKYLWASSFYMQAPTLITQEKKQAIKKNLYLFQIYYAATELIFSSAI